MSNVRPYVPMHFRHDRAHPEIFRADIGAALLVSENYLRKHSSRYERVR